MNTWNMLRQSLANRVSTALQKARLNRLVPILLLALASIIGAPLLGQTPESWQAEVQKDTEAHDWAGALRIVDAEIARHPEDMDIRARRARVLQWAGRTREAEQEFNEVLKKAPDDPDNWLGLGTVYTQEGRLEDALRAMNRAVELDPKRADLRAARARVLRAMGKPDDARQEFQQALNIDPTDSDVRADLASMRGAAKNELRIGVDNDLFNFTSANHDQWTSLVTRWSPHWKTSAAGYFFQYNGIDAGKFVGSVTGTANHWGSLTVGGAVGHDNAVIPKSEAFFEADRGWKVSEDGVFRGLEVVYGQHWYWYSTARILTLSQTAVVYLPRDWTWSIGVIEARSHFTDTPIDWKPSGVAKLGFPIAARRELRLTGNTFFAVGTEDFAQVNQIG